MQASDPWRSNGSRKHRSTERKMAAMVSEGDGGEDLSDSHLLDSICGWVWKHFNQYKVKTLDLPAKTTMSNMPELLQMAEIETESEGKEDDAIVEELHRTTGKDEIESGDSEEDDMTPIGSEMEGFNEPQYDEENPEDPLLGKVHNLFRLSRRRCIYRVPERLRGGNEKAYTPQVVSIGPLHHGKEHLKAMEEHKIRYLQRFLSQTREKVSFSHYIKMIKGQERRLRRFYAESIEFDSDEFVRIVLVDAAFVIELLLGCSRKCEDDYVFNKPQMLWDVRPDLRLLENQLPFFILQDLFNTRFPSSHQPHSLLEISYNFFKSEIDSKGKEEKFKQIRSFGDVQHFVDLLRILYLPLKSKTIKKKNTTPAPTPNVTELRQAGVKFAVGTGSDLFDIKFSNGILEIPKLTVNDTTDLTLRNLLAFEQCHHIEENYLTNYVFLMMWLVKTPKDVELLVEEGIIEKWLGDTERISTLLRDLGNGVMLSNHYYAPLCKQLHEYCGGWHKYMANLRQNYFNTPWSTISVVVAVILLILTFTQTVCSIISVI